MTERERGRYHDGDCASGQGGTLQTSDRVVAPRPRPHPYAVDYSAEQPTLVTFTLADDAGDGTRLTVVGSGFDPVRANRRREAFGVNSLAWEIQMKNVEES